MTIPSDHSDTSDEALAVQLECLRQMTPHERLRRACAWSGQVRRMAFDAIRRRHPEYSEDDVRLRFIELTYGKALADRLLKLLGNAADMEYLREWAESVGVQDLLERLLREVGT